MPVDEIGGGVQGFHQQSPTTAEGERHPVRPETEVLLPRLRGAQGPADKLRVRDGFRS
jgi:hypothetical protein